MHLNFFCIDYEKTKFIMHFFSLYEVALFIENGVVCVSRSLFGRGGDYKMMYNVTKRKTGSS